MKKSILAAALTCIFVLLAFYAKNRIISSKEKQHLTVGFICMGDESVPFSANFLNSQEEINKKYGDKVSVITKYNVSRKSVGKTIEDVVSEKADIIILDSIEFAEASKEYAKKYPKVEFCQATAANANEKPILQNYHNYMGKIYEGRYVSGIVAGMKLKELISQGKISANQAKMGYVAAYPYAEVVSGFTAFYLGAKSIVPTTTMEVTYVGSWNNFFKEEKIAKEMIEDGCVIISQHSDTMGPAIACEKAINSHTVFHIGYNASMSEIAPTTSLVSTKINWNKYILSAIDALLKGKTIEDTVNAQTNGQDSWAGFDENWVQMIDLNNTIAAKGTQKAVKDAIASLKAGKIDVFKVDCMATSINDTSDMIDLSNGYIENKNSSAPTFNYILDKGITVIE